MASQQNPDNSALISTFMEITSSTAEEAQFFLESHNFDVDAAVSTFLESTAAPEPPPAAIAAAAPPPPAADFHSPAQSLSSPSASLSPESSPSRSRSHSPPPAGGARSQYNLRSRRNPSSKNSGNSGRGGIRTLADLNRGGGDGSDSDSDGDRPPRYFTGGEKSGMLVQDPSVGRDVDSFFERARQMGAMEGPADIHQPSSSSRSFTGTARLLSGEVIPSAANEQPPEAVTHTITFWRNGFTVDDGPLRRFNDPENAALLESIARSECPEELEPADRRTKVHMNLVRREDNYTEPAKQQTPFHGVARTLGASSSTPQPSADASALNTAPPALMGLVVDENLPSTSIQLRLADGTRMVSRFNYQHTIRDIHAFIDASRPGRAGNFTLQTVGFPPKALTELDQTIEQAGLANSVVIQKF